MNDSIPGYLPASVLTEMIAIVATLLFGLGIALRRAQWPSRDRTPALWGASALLVGWFFAALIPVSTGFYRGPAAGLPTLPFGLFIPILTGVALYYWWPTMKRVLDAVPPQWIVGVQFYRVLGFIFIGLYAGGKLPGEFALPAGLGDTLVGLLAPLIAIAMARNQRGSVWIARAWNLLGIADLVVAVSTGFLTSPSPIQMLALDHPNQLISAFPLAMIPVFAVPLSILLHLASLAKLRRIETEPRILNRPLVTTRP